MKLVRITFLFGILLTPLYLTKSGSIQLSHFFLIISFVLMLFYKKLYFFWNSNYFSEYLYIELFIFYSFIIGLFWFILYKDTLTIISPFYFVFNYLISNLMITLYKDNIKFSAYFYYTIILSVFSVLIVAIFNLDNYFEHEDYYRRSLTFNNPNQLGYWSLLTATSIFILKDKIKMTLINNFLFYGSIFSIMYFTFISLSKAATFSILILIVLNSLKNKILIVFIMVFGFYIYTNYDKYTSDENGTLVKLEKRINETGEANDDNLVGRGYDRIYNFSEFIVFGAGEGATERFNTEIELHSSFGTLLFSYGFFGIIVISLFLLRIFLKNKKKFIILLIPSLLFGITHMGLRFTFFWTNFVLFLLILSQDENNLSIKKSRTLI